jgi:hypothetical protein
MVVKERAFSGSDSGMVWTFPGRRGITGPVRAGLVRRSEAKNANFTTACEAQRRISVSRDSRQAGLGRVCHRPSAMPGRSRYRAVPGAATTSVPPTCR